MTYEETKKWLNRGYRLDYLIRLDKLKIKELEELSTTLGGFNSTEKVQTSPKLATKYEKYIFDKDKRINSLKSRINERERILEEIDKIINSLEDNLEIEILSYRYLYFMSFRQMEEVAYISKSKCQQIHDKAIIKISLMDIMDTFGH